MTYSKLVIISLVLALVTQAKYTGPFVSVDNLVDLINQTSDVYIPPINKKTPPLLISTEEQVVRDGYPIEVHRIYAEDGQMLTLHRITGPSWQRYRPELGRKPKQPVLVMHGFLGSSQTWLQLPAEKAFPYILADEGFDVWLGNFRTNFYSRSHLRYSTKDKRFWDVSFHEFGIYDIPAKIDHILRTTGYSQIIYVGHSMGTTTFLAMSSSRPEYNSKIMASFLLSPVALTIRTNELTPLLRHILPNSKLIFTTLNKLRLYELLPRNERLYKLIDMSCKPGPLQPLCLEIIAQSYGEHRENINLKELGKAMVGLVAGTTIKNLQHLTQLFETGEFRLFDFGPKENLYRYGRSIPPDYPLDRVTAPIYLYYGLNDVLMSTKAVNRLAQALPNVIQVKAVEDPKFTHLDFLFGNNAKELLFDRLVSKMKALQSFRAQFNSLGYSLYN